MAASVGVKFGYICLLFYPLKKLLNRIVGHWKAFGIDVYAILILRIYRLWSFDSDVVKQRFFGLQADGNFTLLVSFPSNGHFPNGEINP